MTQETTILYGIHRTSKETLEIEVTKKCLECKLEKSLDNFYKSNKKGYFSYCKTCSVALKLKRRFTYYTICKKYGITENDLNNLFKTQNGKCFICEREISLKTDFHVNRACVDHEEGTLNIRGLLCNNCNSGLGHFKHNIEFLHKAINYLKKPIAHIGNEKFKNIRRNRKRINSSGYLGVTFDKTKNLFKAKLAMYGKTINIGFYTRAEEAALAYNEYVKRNVPDYQYIITLNEVPSESEWNIPLGLTRSEFLQARLSKEITF